MTLRAKYDAFLCDLIREQDEQGEVWRGYYARKIENLQRAMIERFGEEV